MIKEPGRWGCIFLFTELRRGKAKVHLIKGQVKSASWKQVLKGTHWLLIVQSFSVTCVRRMRERKKSECEWESESDSESERVGEIYTTESRRTSFSHKGKSHRSMAWKGRSRQPNALCEMSSKERMFIISGGAWEAGERYKWGTEALRHWGTDLSRML